MAHVKVPLAGTATPPEAVYARRIYTGWVVPPDPVLPHRRLTLTQMDLHEDHDLDPGDGELSFMWMNLNRAPDAVAPPVGPCQRQHGRLRRRLRDR